jgi:hypothetical protein
LYILSFLRPNTPYLCDLLLQTLYCLNFIWHNDAANKLFWKNIVLQLTFLGPVAGFNEKIEEKPMFQRWVQITVLWWLSLMMTTLAWAAESSATNWPQEIQTKKGVVVIYQPQPESLKDNQLKIRAAIAVEGKGSKEPVFGAVWMNARLETDRAERTATIVDIDVTDVRFPNIDDKQTKQLSDLLERDIPKWNMVISNAQKQRRK